MWSIARNAAWFMVGLTGVISTGWADSAPPLQWAADPARKHLVVAPQPAAQNYKILRSGELSGPFVEDTTGQWAGFDWTAPWLPTDRVGFYRLAVEPLPTAELLTVGVLNRLAYGPTPGELARVRAMGPDAYIQEQLKPELIQETLEFDRVVAADDWIQVTATGAGSASVIYLYLNDEGAGYIDDMSLVDVAVPGVNLLKNGDFEAPLSAADWTPEGNHAGSSITTEVKRSGASSLRLNATDAGSSQPNSVWQRIAPALSANKQYTLSYWYRPDPQARATAAVRLSGRGIDTVTTDGRTHRTKLVQNQASIQTLRSWHILRAVESKRQLLEVLLQFLENHFVTEYNKSRDWFDRFYEDPQRSAESVHLEYREIERWREALLKPGCTFHDLLKISAESPAMILFLDTVSSRGDGSNIANENYARELLELFTFGVDNGYDQNDIVELSKAWTGWRVGMLKPEDERNPHAPFLFDPSAQQNQATNHTGVWSLIYRANRHDARGKTLFPGRTVPARFGAPYAGKNYELVLPARTGVDGMKDGYEVLAHLADQPFTQEYICVKLCRLFVHDDFEHGHYDYTDPNLSPEGRLVLACMRAWESGQPKGQIRAILSTIFQSELFRSHAAIAQKVKTPLEFTVSALRALRAKVGEAWTVETDGFEALSNRSNPLNRMGGMLLFDRAEPDGYPEAAPPWISAGTLAERLRFVQSLLTHRGQRANGANDAGASYVNPVLLLREQLPASDWTHAAVVADYFVSLLFPGEGRANLALYRAQAERYLNTADDGVTASAFATLATTGNPSPYENRVRGLVSALLSSERFQEQ